MRSAGFGSDSFQYARNEPKLRFCGLNLTKKPSNRKFSGIKGISFYLPLNPALRIANVI